MELFETLSQIEKIFWLIAIPVTIIFAIQAVMTFIGSDPVDGLDANFDGDLDGGDANFQLFSFRNLINFLLGFSWTGISFYNIITSPISLIAVSFTVGAFFVFIFYVIISQLRKLAENNSFSIGQAVGKSAQVYLAIPGNKTGKGKIILSVRGSVHELDAITHGNKIETGAMVKILQTENDDLLVVELL
jgi:hypothetical protein